MKKIICCLIVFLSVFTLSAETVTVKPESYSGALRNPLKGFRPDIGKAAFTHEYGTLARCYIRWNDIENSSSDGIEKIKVYCNRRWKGIENQNIKVIPRVILDWKQAKGDEFWPSDLKTGDYTSAAFTNRLLRMIGRLGECWDNDPRVAWVQMGLIGAWGEHHSPHISPTLQKCMGDAFRRAFKNKKILVRQAGNFPDCAFGIYWDSWAHITQWNDGVQGAREMRKLVKETRRHLIAPFEGETAYNWGKYREQPGDSPDDTLGDPVHTDFLHETIRSLHGSALGWVANYHATNAAIRAGADRIQKSFGYRFLLNEISFDDVAGGNNPLHVTVNVRNEGSAPFYYPWPVVAVLLDPSTRKPVWEGEFATDIRSWFPGESWNNSKQAYDKPAVPVSFSGSFVLPSSLAEGKYILALAVLDPAGRLPSLRFACKNYFTGGFHPVGFVRVGRDGISAGQEKIVFDDPSADKTLHYVLSPDDLRQLNAEEAKTVLSSRFLDETDEALTTFRLLERELSHQNETCRLARDRQHPPAFQPPVSEVCNTHALIWPSDRDPLDVLVRRTRALCDDLQKQTDLKEESKCLQKLEEEAGKTGISNRDARFQNFQYVMRLRRRIAFKNPLVRGISKLLFIGREAFPPDEFDWGVHMCDQFFGFHATQKHSTRGDGLYVLKDPFTDHPSVKNIVAGRKITSASKFWNGKQLFPAGGFLSPDVSYDGKKILFSWTPGIPKIREWNELTTFHIMKCNEDGSALEMITWGSTNDLFPCWLPNGRIVFVSERRGGYGRCHFRKCPNFTLFTMFPDGTDITCISPHETNEFEPSVDNNGMIVYTRWDYVDRGFNQAHHPWITYPDGRDPREWNGNTRKKQSVGPHFTESIRAIPESRKYVATSCGHHTLMRGSIILLDPTVPDDDAMSQIKRVTPDQLLPESEWIDWSTRHTGAYATAWPLSEKYFLCVYDGDANGQYGAVDCRRRNYALTLLDVFGNKIRIYKDPFISCMDPMPLAARPVPPVIPHRTLVGRPAGVDGKRPVPIPADKLPGTATVGLINVYNTRYPFPKGVTVKALRIWQILPKSEPIVGHPRLGITDQTPGRQCLGTVPVEKDGSAYFDVPTGIPFYMQALDEEGCAVQTMRSVTYTAPGEQLTCNGCHENKTALAQQKQTPLAMQRKPSQIKEEVDGSKPFNYPRLVQPVLDAKCVSCHGEKRKAGMPDLRKGNIETNPYSFHTSFIDLVAREMVQCYTVSYKGPKWYTVNVQRDDFVQPFSEPGKIGARGSPLYRLLKSGHHGVTLTPEEKHRLILFLDSQGAYLSHDLNAKAQCEGKIVLPVLQ